jgi:hypothetical protein
MLTKRLCHDPKKTYDAQHNGTHNQLKEADDCVDTVDGVRGTRLIENAHVASLIVRFVFRRRIINGAAFVELTKLERLRLVKLIQRRSMKFIWGRATRSKSK